MVKHYLDEAISELGELIAITKQDIENIQKADHSHVDDHSKKKTELVRKFEKTKSQLDNELVKLAQANAGTDLASILSDEIKDVKKILFLLESATSSKDLGIEFSVCILKFYYSFYNNCSNTFISNITKYLDKFYVFFPQNNQFCFAFQTQ
mgnify:CR=1 FL=1